MQIPEKFSNKSSEGGKSKLSRKYVLSPNSEPIDAKPMETKPVDISPEGIKPTGVELIGMEHVEIVI